MRLPPAWDRPLRFQRPSLPSGEAIESYLHRSREARWFSNGGPCCELLRKRLGERVGAHCVPVASGTAGLIVAVAAALDGRPAGGRALMPSFTFPATAQAALWNGLRPYLADVDDDHWHLDPDVVERALARHDHGIAVVLAVSTFGTPAPSDVRGRWEQACRGAGVPLVIDSAAGYGAVADDGRAIGAQGDVEVVSFHATKPFAIGEGGAVFTRHAALRERIERATNFGFGPEHVVAMGRGLNAKMSELHAATGLAVLDGFDAALQARRDAARQIRDAADPAVGWQRGCERSTWQFVPVRFATGYGRDAAVDGLRERLETRTYYEPIHKMAAMAPVIDRAGDLTVTECLGARVLALPMAADLTEEELDLLCDAVAAAPWLSPAR